MGDIKKEKNLVYEVESDIIQYSRITKLSYRKDPEYFAGRAGMIRILNLFLATGSVLFMIPGYKPERLDPAVDYELIKMMRNANFTGYGVSHFTIAAMAFGGSTVFISLLFIILLYLFMEVRCDLLWECINQKANVLACILSILAAFCDVFSLQDIQIYNCKIGACEEEEHDTKTVKQEESFYPPYFFYHYTAFVGFLSNAMLYSIASRIWLRNDD